MAFLDTHPDRLGHATFLDQVAKQRVVDNKIGIELCLTSNVLFVLPWVYHVVLCQ